MDSDSTKKPGMATPMTDPDPVTKPGGDMTTAGAVADDAGMMAGTTVPSQSTTPVQDMTKSGATPPAEEEVMVPPMASSAEDAGVTSPVAGMGDDDTTATPAVGMQTPTSMPSEDDEKGSGGMPQGVK